MAQTPNPSGSGRLTSESSAQSTPYSQGLASNAQFRTSEFLADVVKEIAVDLKKSQTCSFTTMVKGLITRFLMEDKAIEPASDAIEKAATIYGQCLQAAVEFCNMKAENTSSAAKRTSGTTKKAVSAAAKKTFDAAKRSERVKNSLRRYCKERKEKYRYQPLVEALNDILQQFREAELGFGKCHTDSDQDFSSEILFTVNDPAIIKSKRLPKTVTKRKPDIIALFIARIKMILSSELKDMPYGEYITAINLGERAKGEVTAPTWVDVLQSWELKAEKRIDSTRLSDPYDRDDNSNTKDDDVIMKEETLAEGDESEVEEVDKKRKMGSNSQSGQSKKQRSDASSAKSAPDVEAGGVKSRKTWGAAVQSACYAIERLTAQGKCILHTIGVTLEDSKLTLSWYDAQGLVESKPIDIIADLPEFIVMIMIFQRFDKRMWGEAPFEYTDMTFKEFSGNADVKYEVVKEENDGGEVKHKAVNEVEPRFYELVGRNTIKGKVRRKGEPWATTKKPTTEGTSAAEIQTAPPATAERELRSGAKAKAEAVATPTPASAKATPTPVSELRFMKLAWSETTRFAEHAFLRKALDEAPKKLKQYASLVTDHIADPKATLELPESSTGIIRNIFGCDPKGARVLRGLISSLLQPITDLKGQQFWDAYWDAIQSTEGHALLWYLGIAHGDISLGNLMFRVEPASDGPAAASDSGHASFIPTTSNDPQPASDATPPTSDAQQSASSSAQAISTDPPPSASKVKVIGVLNDLDLASLINSETGAFNQDGFERTGTKPYIAYQLMTDAGIDGQIRRRYRHDLESFAWVSVYVCGCIRGGKDIPVEPFKDWLVGSYKQIRAFKGEFWRQPNCYKPTDDFAWFERLANAWISAWEDIDQKLQQKIDPVPEGSGLSYLATVVEIAEKAKMPFALPPMHWIDDFKI